MSDVKQNTKEEVEKLAADRGLFCFLPNPDELLIDWDNPKIPPRLDIELLLKAHGVCFISRLDTRSGGGNRHIYIKLNRFLNDTERVAMQAALGSDAKREALALLNIMDGKETPTALFETHEEAARVREWRGEF